MARKGIPVLDFDDLITAIQALSAPSATNVAISPTGMHIVTEDDVQGAISELDTAVDSVNSSLTQKQDKILTGNFSGTTDAGGNIALPNNIVNTSNSVILAVVSTSGYCTGVAVSGTTWYVKVLSNNNPVTPVANTNTNIYYTYILV